MVEKVGYTRPVNTARPVRKSGGVAAPGFAEALAAAEGVGDVDAAEAASAVGAIGLGSLLGAQEVDEREARRHKAVKRARLTLDTLEQLRDALLIGLLPVSTLENLTKMIERERQDHDDPRLSAVLDEIEVRAAVELAKLEMSGFRQSSST